VRSRPIRDPRQGAEADGAADALADYSMVRRTPFGAFGRLPTTCFTVTTDPLIVTVAVRSLVGFFAG
jgi:hypothetical protein